MAKNVTTKTNKRKIFNAEQLIGFKTKIIKPVTIKLLFTEKYVYHPIHLEYNQNICF